MLEKHYFNQEERIASGNECHYFGHLVNEKGACVSMTGCLGSEDILFTIMSVHATDSPYFEWTKEGEVNAIDLEQIVSGNRKSFIARKSALEKTQLSDVLISDNLF